MIYNQAKSLIFEHIDNHHSQAFLIEGSYKSGQKMLAQEIIQFYNKTYVTDTIWVHKDQEKSRIGLSDILPIKQNMMQSPLYGNYSFFVIQDADFLTKEAQNSLLKIIEEPNNHSIIFLLGTYHQLLPTIYSRCLSVYIDNVSPEGLSLGHYDLAVEILHNPQLENEICDMWKDYISLLQSHRIDVFQYAQNSIKQPIELLLFVWETIHWLLLLACTDKPRYTKVRLPKSLQVLLSDLASKTSITWNYTVLNDLKELKKTMLFSNRKNLLALEQFLLSNHPNI